MRYHIEKIAILVLILLATTTLGVTVATQNGTERTNDVMSKTSTSQLATGFSSTSASVLPTQFDSSKPIINQPSDIGDSVLQADPDLYVKGPGFADQTYIISGTGIDSYDIGDDIIVYSEIVPDTEVPIALLRVTAKNPSSLTAQAILIHPDRIIRPDLRVDGNIMQLSTSELLPTVSVAIAYVLRPGRIRLLSDIDVRDTTIVEALEPEIIDGAIVDYLPFAPSKKFGIANLGVQGLIASAEILEGDWPAPGTLLVESQLGAQVADTENQSGLAATGPLSQAIQDLESNWQFNEAVGQVGDNGGWATVVDHEGAGILTLVTAFGSWNSEHILRVTIDGETWKEYTGHVDPNDPVSSNLDGTERWSILDDSQDHNSAMITLLPMKYFESSLKIEIFNGHKNHELSARANYFTPKPHPTEPSE